MSNKKYKVWDWVIDVHGNIAQITDENFNEMDIARLATFNEIPVGVLKINSHQVPPAYPIDAPLVTVQVPVGSLVIPPNLLTDEIADLYLKQKSMIEGSSDLFVSSGLTISDPQIVTGKMVFTDGSIVIPPDKVEALKTIIAYAHVVSDNSSIGGTTDLQNALEKLNLEELLKR